MTYEDDHIEHDCCDVECCGDDTGVPEWDRWPTADVLDARAAKFLAKLTDDSKVVVYDDEHDDCPIDRGHFHPASEHADAIWHENPTYAAMRTGGVIVLDEPGFTNMRLPMVHDLLEAWEDVLWESYVARPKDASPTYHAVLDRFNDWS